jgi:Tfp pilus assembly protein PilV
MTLLESLVALVVLGLSAVGFLELFQRVTRQTADTAAWTRSVAMADAVLERAAAGDASALRSGVDSTDEWRVIVGVRPIPAGLREVTVTVTSRRASGPSVVLRRLVAP